MSGIALDANALMDFELLTGSEDAHYEANLAIYFVLMGKLTVHLSEEMLVLSENDFLIVSPFQTHSICLDESSLTVRFLVNLGKISEYYEVSQLDFLGNSVEEESGQHLALRRLLEKCTAYYYGKKTGNGRVLLKLNSLYYEIAELLISAFSVARKPGINEGKVSDEMLVREITGYIHLNYQSTLRLDDLAEHFFLSSAYISRFFKKKMGENFTKYLTGIRLHEAEKKLKAGDATLTRIAMDCGFPNQAAFNTAFREKYHMNPKAYRESMLERKQDIALGTGNSSQPEMQLLEYFEARKTLTEDVYEDVKVVDADADQYEILTKNWNKMISIGGVYLLLQREMQDQVLFLCKTLGFDYVRIWDLYDKRMHINASGKNGRYNFSRLDKCFDFLVENQIKPYIELGFKPYVLVKDYEKFTFDEERKIWFDNPEEYGDFVRKMLIHMVNRYGVQQVSSWIYELWGDPRWFHENDGSEYIAYFEQAYQAIKTMTPLAGVGGAYDRSYGVISFERFIQQWSLRSIQPDFVSVYCYGSLIRDVALEELESAGNIIDSDAVRNFGIKEYIRLRKEILIRNGMRVPLYVSEWNYTVINANVVNDSIFKGAYMMKSIMDVYQETDLLGYWFGTDLFVDEDEEPMLVNGRCGLITHQGICKPAYWVLWMLNRLEPYVLQKTSNMIITRNAFDSYIIACHNYKDLDIQFYRLSES